MSLLFPFLWLETLNTDQYLSLSPVFKGVYWSLKSIAVVPNLGSEPSSGGAQELGLLWGYQTFHLSIANFKNSKK